MRAHPVGRWIASVVGAVPWLFGLLAVLAGTVLFFVRRELAARGHEAEAVVEECRVGSTTGRRDYECRYRFRPAGSASDYDGTFRSRQYLSIGTPVMIRYLSDQPTTSAAVEDLRDEAHVAPSLVLLGAGGLVWLTWRARRRRGEARS